MSPSVHNELSNKFELKPPLPNCWSCIFEISSPFTVVTVFCVWVYVSVCLLPATYLVYMSKVKRHTVSCRLLKTRIVWTWLKTFPLGDVALFACHDDWWLGSFSIKYTPMILDTMRSGMIYEPLARSDNYVNYNDLLWLSWILGLTAFLLTHRSWLST